MWCMIQNSQIITLPSSPAAASWPGRASTQRTALRPAPRPHAQLPAPRTSWPARKSRQPLNARLVVSRVKAMANNPASTASGATLPQLSHRPGLSATPVAAEQRAVAGAREDEVPAERREAVGEVAVLAEGVDGRVRRARVDDADAPVGAARRDEGVARQRRDARGRAGPGAAPVRGRGPRGPVVAVARVPAPHAAVLVAAHEAVADRAERDAVARLLVGPARWEATGESRTRTCADAAGSRRSRVREQVPRS